MDPHPGYVAPARRLALAAATAGAALLASATDLTVKVVGIAGPRGEVGCALFSRAKGFPMNNGPARQAWTRVEPQGATCRFVDVAPGSYAVSVVQDLNGNRKLDANFLGIPIEPWGVSNNVRPSLRAPRWDEAVFHVDDRPELSIEIGVAR